MLLRSNLLTSFLLLEKRRRQIHRLRTAVAHVMKQLYSSCDAPDTAPIYRNALACRREPLMKVAELRRKRLLMNAPVCAP